MKGTWPASFGARISGLLGRLVGAHGRWSGVDGVAAVAVPRRSAVTMLIDRIPSARARRVAMVVVADIVPTAAVGAIMLGASGHAAREQVPPSRPLDGAAYMLLGLATFLFPLRRRFSLLLFAAEALLLGTYIATGYPHGPPGAALIVVAFTVGLRAPECRAAGAAKAGAVLLVLATVVAYARGYVAGGWGLASAVVSVLCVVVVPTVLGTLLRVRRLASARAKEDETRRRIDQERLRMAREVHDVVGHGLSIISLQAAVALHVLDRRPEQAQVALEAIRRTSVDALDELRATLALTRAGSGRRISNTAGADTARADAAEAGRGTRSAAAPGAGSGTRPPDAPAGGPAGTSAGEAPRTPLTGLRRLPGLIAEVRLCGTTVELVTTGDLGAVPAEVDLAAYRVVQESLTNVLRHAGPAEVRVALHSAGGQLRIEVRDRPTQAPAGSHGATLVTPVGHGLRGLRERVEELGGSLTAGPSAAGGWRVHTELPLGPGPTARRTTGGAAAGSAGAPVVAGAAVSTAGGASGAARTAGVESPS